MPDGIGNWKNLHEFYGWNNSLTALPSGVKNLKFITAFDARYNQFTELPSSTNQWTGIEYLGLYGNPLCANFDIPSNLKGAKGLCEKQCAMDCPNFWLGDASCDDNEYTYNIIKAVQFPMDNTAKPNSGCNTATCEYDKGACKVVKHQS